MKRYRLKKDLPTFKAGEIFEISSNGNLIRRGECISDCMVVYARQTLEKFPNILKDWFEEIPEKPKTVWDLKEGDKCYVLNSWGDSSYPSRTEWSDAWRNNREVGEVFLTELECNREIARRKAKQILLRDTKGFKPDWKDSDQIKYYVAHNATTGALFVEMSWNSNCGAIIFKTWEDATDSINKYRQEWLTYLGVEE